MGHSFKLIGAPCASRGPYTFYKAFKYTKNNITNILTINEFFFVKLWSDSDLISIGELRLLWEDKNCDRALASLRLYILPENTPDGRSNDIHGEDEVLAITEKVVIKLEDLLTWITEASDWHWGLGTVWQQECLISTDNDDDDCESTEPTRCSGSSSDKENCLFCDEKIHTLVDCSALDYSDVHKEKRHLDKTNWETRTGVIVLSYARYCRYRGLLKRLEGVHNEWLRNKLIKALGGFTTTCRTTKVLFCKDTFDYPELEGHELLCNHLAPKLRSRIPKKKKALYPSPDASEEESSSDYATDDDHLSSSASSSSASTHSRSSNATSRSSNYVQEKVHNQQPLPTNVPSAFAKNGRSAPSDHEKKQKAFIQNLYSFMKARLTPIGRLPQIGSREINLFEFYNKVKSLGGHSSVTNNKLWKLVFEEMGGEQNNAAATSLARKHYEKFLLPYEQHMAQQLKHANNRLPVKAQNDTIRKPQTTSSNVTETDSRKKTAIVSTRPVQNSASKYVEVKPTINAFSAKPGDKENIPLVAKKPSSCATGTEVIDLCDVDDERSPSKTTPQPPPTASSTAEIIDLCGECPIKRSVPSIAATLLPRKRKLDILKEGGLEVTPVSVPIGSSSSRDVVTITRQSVDNSNAIAAYMERLSAKMPEAEMSVELIEPNRPSRRHSEEGNECGDRATLVKMSKSSSNQVLDLRTMRNEPECNLIKSISPNLGPNIEISLVPSDGAQRDEKRRKSAQLPIPALRKISTGELTTTKTNNGRDSIAAHRSANNRTHGGAAADPTLKNYAAETFVSMSAGSVETTLTPAYSSADRKQVADIHAADVDQYIAALYGSIISTNDSGSGFVARSPANANANATIAHGLQLTPAELIYMNSSLVRQPQRQELSKMELNDKTLTAYDSYRQKLTAILKNNTISIIDNYEKIVPD